MLRSKLIYIFFLFQTIYVNAQTENVRIKNIVSENILNIHLLNEALVVLSFLEYRETDNKVIYEVSQKNSHSTFLEIDAKYTLLEVKANATNSFCLFTSVQDSILVISINHKSKVIERFSFLSQISLSQLENNCFSLFTSQNKLWLYAMYSEQDNRAVDVVYCFDESFHLINSVKLPTRSTSLIRVSRTVFSVGDCTFLHSLFQNQQTGDFRSDIAYIDATNTLKKYRLLSDEFGHYIPHKIVSQENSFHLAGVYCLDPNNLNEKHSLFYQSLNLEGEVIINKRYFTQNTVSINSIKETIRNRSAQKLKVRCLSVNDSIVSIFAEAYYVENGNSTLKFILDVIEPDRFAVQLGEAIQLKINRDGLLSNSNQIELISSTFLLPSGTNSLQANLLDNQINLPYIFQFVKLENENLSFIHHKKYESFFNTVHLRDSSKKSIHKIVLNDTAQMNIQHKYIKQNQALKSVNKMKSRTDNLGAKFQALTNSIEYSIEQVDFALELLNPLRNYYKILSNGRVLAYWIDLDSQSLIYTQIP